MPDQDINTNWKYYAFVAGGPLRGQYLGNNSTRIECVREGTVLGHYELDEKNCSWHWIGTHSN